ncbi:MAG TPA: SGNH/GDSL hydrolase family protein [Pseudonocardiaceae bacterium]|jgi:lysophospholipase L1-like esterase|nr:SGNH/GDSL hydrolase family protein [Pseudonocardiaceae bacterium]
MTYQRFVALGDSCAEGLDDPYPGGRIYRGWADLVAGRLAADAPGFRYANLAVRGRRLDQIITEQLPTATALRPDLVALFGGGNDVMSRGFAADVVRTRVHTAVRELTRLAPTVVVFTISDISQRMPIVRGMGARLAVLNAAMREAADTFGALLVDLCPDETVHDLRYFGPDRLHLSEPGHRRVAAHLLATLGRSYDPDWLTPLPGPALRPGVLDHAEWVWRQVLPVAYTRMRNRLVGRLPGDGFGPKRPQLLPVHSGEPSSVS